jgi:dihydroorotate dehydrogenase electron transfer subunit
MMETYDINCLIEQVLPYDTQMVKISFRSNQIAAVAKPGQFVMIHTSQSKLSSDPLLRRPFSIHDINGDLISLLIKVVGRGSEILSNLSTGNYIDVLGPLGKSFPDISDPVIIVGGGMGLAPLKFLARRMTGRNEIKILLGGATGDDIKIASEFESFGQTIIYTEDGSAGQKGLITAGLIKELELTPSAVLACGPEGMLKAVADICHQYECLCYVSMEARMACGLGACLGCVCETKSGERPRVCVDGPVFNAERIFYGK